MKPVVQKSLSAVLAAGIAYESVAGHAHPHTESQLPVDPALNSPIVQSIVTTTFGAGGTVMLYPLE